MFVLPAAINAGLGKRLSKIVRLGRRSPQNLPKLPHGFTDSARWASSLWACRWAPCKHGSAQTGAKKNVDRKRATLEGRVHQ